MKKIILTEDYQPLNHQLMQMHVNSLDQAQESFYLLPTRPLLYKAREMFREHYPKDVILGNDFYTFDDIVNVVLERANIQINLIDDVIKQIIVSRILHQLANDNRLRYLQEIAHYPGVADKVVHLIGELKRANCQPQDFMSPTDPSDDKAKKDHDLGLIYSEYQKALRKRDLYDIEETYFCTIALCQQRDNSAIDGIEQLIIAGFDFSPLQLALIKSLGRCIKNVVITLPYDSDRPLLFGNTQQAVDDLRRDGFTAEKLQAKSNSNQLSSFLFNPKAQPTTIDSEVGIWRCWSLRSEAREIAREIKRLNLKQGISLDNIAVVIKDKNAYLQSIISEFTQAQIPLLAHKEIPLTDVAITKKVMTLLKVVIEDWRQPAFLELLTMGGVSWPAGFSAKDLEAFVRSTPNADGGLSSWQQLCRQQKQLAEAQLGIAASEQFFNSKKLQIKIEQLERAYYAMEALNELWSKAICLKGTFTDIAGGLINLLKQLQLQEDVHSLFNKGELEIALLNYRAWELILATIKEQQVFTELWADFKMSLNEFYAVLSNTFEALVVPEDRQYGNNRVNIASPSSIRGLTYDYVFIVGCNDGVFPAKPRDDWFYGEAERDILRRQGVNFRQPSYVQTQERMFFYLSVASSSSKIYLTYAHLSGQEEQLLPSPFVDEVMRLTQVQPNKWSPSSILNLRPPLAVHQEESNQILASLGATSQLNEGLAQRIEIENARQNLEFNKYNGVLDHPDIKKNLAAKYCTDKIFSTSALGQFGSCPFAFYLQRVLYLAEVEQIDDELTPLSRGNILHKVLANFLQQHTNSRLVKTKLQQYREELEDLTITYLDRLSSRMTHIGNSLTGLEAARSVKTLWRWLDAELAYQAAVDFTPTQFEVKFAAETAVCLGSCDDPVKIEGFIDRIDTTAENYIVFDYKSGEPPSIADIEAGTEFQMPIYILAAEKLLSSEKKAAGAGYYRLKGKFDRNKGMWRAECLADAGLSSRIGDQLIQDDWQELMQQVEQLVVSYRSAMRQGDFRLHPAACKDYCLYKSICRYTDDIAIRLEGGERLWN